MSEQEFSDWFAANYPKNTIIHDPLWHAPKIYRRAARGAVASVAGVPDDVLYALNRMCSPLHESRLSGVTAEEDARCMQLIRDHVIAAPVTDAPIPSRRAGI